MEEEKLKSVIFLIEKYHVSPHILKGSKSVVHEAANWGHLQILDYLLQFVNINIKDNEGSTPLFYTILSNKISVEKKISVSEFLIKKGADVNARDKSLLTPLTLSIVSPYITLTEYFIDNEAVDVNLIDKQGISPLLRVILSENSDSDSLQILKHFLEHKTMNISETKTPDGSNALHLSANLGKLKIMDYLVANTNLSLSDVDDNGNSVLIYLISSDEISEKEKINIIRHFQEKFDFSEINNALDDCMVKGYYEIAEYLLQSTDVDINLKDSDGNSAIHLLITSEMDETNKLKFLKLLTEKYDANLFLHNSYNHGTLLHLCAFFGLTEILEYLVLEKKLNINQQDSLGRTPLMLTVSSADINHTQSFLTAQYLVEHLHADLSPKNILGDSVVSVSHRLEIFSVYQYLIAQTKQRHVSRNKVSKNPLKPLSILDTFRGKHKY